jgi:transposase
MSTDAASLPDDPAALKALLLRERKVWHAEQERFQRERQQHAQLVAGYEQTVHSQKRTIEQQLHQLAQLLRKLYGPRQERIDPDQLMLFDAQDLEQLAAELQQDGTLEGGEDVSSTGSRRRRRRGHGRRPLPAHLPREQVLYELSEAERQCPCCGEVRQEMGRQTSEQLEYIPAELKVIEHIRVKYACRQCEEHVAIAARPPQPIAKGLPGPGLLAQTVLSKYGDHLPLYRQEDILMRHGVVIRRSTLCDWIASAADLAEPLYERMGDLVRASRIIHTDDTPVKLLDPLLGKARTARFWAYIGDAGHPYAVYDFTDSRKRDGPAQFLEGFSGYLQADAYGGYDGLYRDPRRNILEVACWTHTRRYWWEARTTDSRRAHEALAYIGRLYQIEELVREAAAEAVYAARQTHALPILAEFHQWLQHQQPHVLPKSPIGQALRYTTGQWDALVRYCDDGQLAVDNNVSERTVKIPAIGRKNWLFVASRAGGRRAAILFSLVASCKANAVEPWAYLRDLFTRLPSLPDDQLDELLPDRWLATHPQHRWHIDDLRRQERQQKHH